MKKKRPIYSKFKKTKLMPELLKMTNLDFNLDQLDDFLNSRLFDEDVFSFSSFLFAFWPLKRLLFSADFNDFIAGWKLDSSDFFGFVESIWLNTGEAVEKGLNDVDKLDWGWFFPFASYTLLSDFEPIEFILKSMFIGVDLKFNIEFEYADAVVADVVVESVIF
jgi:hypothetical protein